ncbi:MAG: hypothetical protein ABSA13_11835 [Beijerinckiaceae bacterium]|jgi:hypothetical protein
MTGLLVIAELEAFRSILGGATRDDREKIKLWSRSTISNALHRVGPGHGLKEAALRAWADADAFAGLLAQPSSPEEAINQARVRALDSIEALIAEIRAHRSASA